MSRLWHTTDLLLLPVCLGRFVPVTLATATLSTPKILTTLHSSVRLLHEGLISV
jgi:hypothetical protein